MMSTILSVALVINELMASNAGSVMSPAYNFVRQGNAHFPGAGCDDGSDHSAYRPGAWARFARPAAPAKGLVPLNPFLRLRVCF